MTAHADLIERIRVLADDETSTDVEEAIQVAGKRRTVEVAEDVLALMERTKVRNLRNTCAYFFHECPQQAHTARLVAVAQRADVPPHRGSILYALSEHDCSAHLPFLAEVIVSDWYEAAQHACDAVEALPQKLPRDGVLTALGILRAAVATEPWRKELVNIAAAELDERESV